MEEVLRCVVVRSVSVVERIMVCRHVAWIDSRLTVTVEAVIILV